MAKDLWFTAAIVSVVLLMSSVLTHGFTSFAILNLNNNPSANAKASLDLFVMSHCPYGVQAEQILKDVVDVFGTELKFNLYFIASESNGIFSSMHGQAEVDEDLRQVCIMKYSPSDLYDYLMCLAPNYTTSGTVWESCAQQNNIDVNKIKTCYQGDEGKSLLSENLKKANELKIGSSPTIYINGQKYAGSRNAASIQSFLCSENTTLSGCSSQVGTSAPAAQGGC